MVLWLYRKNNNRQYKIMYIWNRAERVKDTKNITTCFNRWTNKQKQLKKFMSNQKDRIKIQKKIDKQTRNYEEAINKINRRESSQIANKG
jgi:hypothetical protein